MLEANTHPKPKPAEVAWRAVRKKNTRVTEQVSRCFHKSEAGDFALAFRALFAEYRSKMLESVGAKGVALSETQIEAILAALAHFAEPVPVYFRLRPNLRDEGDNFVFECAAHFNASHIVTHNLRDFQNPTIRGYNVSAIKPGAFLKLLNEEQSP